MDKFYFSMVSNLLVREKIHRDMSILVVCGEALDAETFSRHGFKQVAVTNLDDRHEGSWGTGAEWSQQDAEALSYSDASFDLVVVHSGLHHCRQPHRALCEMYRVARKGVLMIEPCENWMVKIGQKFGVGQEYEVHAVAFHHLKAGGVNNTPIPNNVYRWTVGEVRRTITSFAPEFRHQIWFRNNLVVHWHDLWSKKNRFRFILMVFIFPFLKLFSLIIPRLGNILGVYIDKAGVAKLNPWLKSVNGEIQLNPLWFSRQISVGK